MDEGDVEDRDMSAVLDAAESHMLPQSNPGSTTTGIQQPKPQGLLARTGPSSILVSPRQKGNPILNNIRALPWEYSDIPADYVLGVTTCALFLSLKYHRLHPEYIYTRIRALAGKYNLRIVLTMVDIQNHEESLKELSKTSLINNVTIILCWTAQEAGRYLELFKSFEHAAPTSIKAHQSTTYSDKLVEFITVPRSINKTDAVGLVSSFGSLRAAVNARPEEVALVAGWGEKKVQRWCNTVRDNFRIQKAAKRGIATENSRRQLNRDGVSIGPEDDTGMAARLGISTAARTAAAQAKALAYGGVKPYENDGKLQRNQVLEPDNDEEQAMLEATAQSLNVLVEESRPQHGNRVEPALSHGISAALEKLRRQS